MTIEEKITLVQEWTGELTEHETETARAMLETAGTVHGGSYAPPYVARWILMHRAGGELRQERSDAVA